MPLSIITFFVNCTVLFFAPLLGSTALFYRSSVPWQSLVTNSCDVDPAALILSFYSYWSLTYGAKKKIFIVFVDIAATTTIALTVTPTTTISDMRDALCHHGHAHCRHQGPVYLMGLLCPLRPDETMSDLGVQGLRHFIMPPRMLGGAPAHTVQADGTVVNERGWEQDAKDIDFGPDPGAEQPSGSSGRPSRAPSARFKAAVAAAQESDSDHPNRKKRKRKTRTWKGKSKATQSELEDSAFSSGSGEETEDSEADAKITNEGLPTTTFPEGSRRSNASGAPKRKKRKVAAAASTSTIVSETAQKESSTTKGSKKRNPLWLFFTDVTETNHGEKGESTDDFYRCNHGESRKVLRMTKLMRGSLNGKAVVSGFLILGLSTTGLDQHLKSHAPDMCRFYEMLNSRDRSIRPSDEEIEIARGEKKFATRDEFLEYLGRGESAAEHRQQSLREAFARSGEKAAGPWDQAKFEELLVEWLVACDQPFQEVERPELRRLLESRRSVLSNAVSKKWEK
ncbi:hypothetical protein B0H10DRAFT_1965559 [Mycena sp. CBHHK59/15]|nr:hypothetical protein B0H10DRAFT_1965559 [Mycena sp. CBHHK59/15]